MSQSVIMIFWSQRIWDIQTPLSNAEIAMKKTTNHVKHEIFIMLYTTIYHPFPFQEQTPPTFVFIFLPLDPIGDSTSSTGFTDIILRLRGDGIRRNFQNIEKLTKNQKCPMLGSVMYTHGHLLRTAHKLSATKMEHSHWSISHSTHLWLADKRQMNL